MTTITDEAPHGAAGDPQVVEWVRRAQEGSGEAFACLYDHYVNMVFGYILHRVGHRQTAEDLVADVFMRALRRVDSFRWQGKDFGAWLMTIARNRVHDHFKSARFRMEASVEEVFDTARDDDPDDPETVLLSGEDAARVHAAIRELKPEQAEVVELRFLRHLDVAETAAVMRRTQGAVKALQYRALRSLARVLENAS